VKKAYLRASTAATMAMVATIVSAQTGPTAAPPPQNNGVGLEEIIVTAQRRAENLQNVPVSISAFTQAELDVRNVIGTRSLGQYIPNLVATSATGISSANVYFLRGLGSAETVATVDPPVGTYVDEIFIARANANNFGFFDLDRVEVLRGPQGTLFGRNTTGGAINVVLKRPSTEAGGYAEASYGRYNRVFLRGWVDVPLSENVLTKFSGYFNDSEGYINNLTTGEKLNGERYWGVRGALRVLAGETVTWDAAASYQRDETLNVLGFGCDLYDLGKPANCSGRYATSGLRQRPLNGETPLVNLVIAVPGLGNQPTTLANGKGNIPFGTRTGNTLLTSNIGIELGEANLNLITGYVDYDQRYLLDQADGRGSRAIGNFNPPVLAARNGGNSDLTAIVKGNQFSQEAKITGALLGGALRYVGGVYYITETNTTDFADILGTVSTVTADRTLRNKASAIAGYLQLDGKVADWLTLTAGIRYTDERKSFTITDQRDPRVDTLVAPSVGATPVSTRLNTANAAAFGIPTRLVSKIWTPRFAVELRPASDIMVFASATKGFRSGAWAGRAQRIDQFFPVRPEIVWSYEAGIKSEFFDHRVRANLTVYQSDTTDAQLPSVLIDPRTNGTVFTTLNDADIRNRGFEAELQFRPTRGLTLYVNGATQDAQFRNLRPLTLTRQQQCVAARAAGGLGAGICGTGVITAQGTIARPPRTPKLQLQAGASYDAEFGGFTLTPSVNVVHSSRYETLTANVSFYRDGAGNFNTEGNGAYVGGSLSPAYTMVNASLALRLPDDRIRFVVQCDNCFGATYTVSGLNGYAFLPPPGTWLVSARYKF